MKGKSSETPKTEAPALCFPPRTIKELIQETDLKSIQNELTRTDRKKRPIRYLYLRVKKDIRFQITVEGREKQWDFFPTSYKIESPYLIYLGDRYDWERRAEALDPENECEFINIKNVQNPDMVIKVEKIIYGLMKEPPRKEEDEFLHKSYSPHIFKKEDMPELFKGQKGSFCLVECEFPTKISLGYLTDKHFREEKMPYKILLISKDEKKKYFKGLMDEVRMLEHSCYQHPFLPSIFFNNIFPRLSDIIEEFQKHKIIRQEDIEFINEIKCFCEFKIDPVFMFLISIIESFGNLLLTQKLLSICEHCGNVFRYRQGKKYCSLLKEGKNCGEKARKKRDYERHKDRRRKYYKKEMKETRDFLKKVKIPSS